MRIVAVAALALGLDGCAAAPPPDPMVLIRTDGQKIGGNLSLEQQLKIDTTVCEGSAAQSQSNMQPIYTNGSLGSEIGASIIRSQRDDTLMSVAKGCFAQKGYVLVPRSQVEIQSAEFAKTAKLRQKPS